MAADTAFSEYLAIFEDEQQRKPSSSEKNELRARLEAGRPPLDTLRLLTVLEYAESEGITTQAAYKRISQGKMRCVSVGTGKKKKRCIIVPAAEYPAEQAARVPVKAAEPATAEPPEAENRQPVSKDNPGAALIGADTRGELEQLREENKRLRAQLDEERAAARAQSDRILSLAERLADLTAASQVLMQQQQAGQLTAHVVEVGAEEQPEQKEKSGPTAEETPNGASPEDRAGANPTPVSDLAEPAAQPKKGFFARLFGA